MFRPFSACVALLFLSASTSSPAQPARPAVDVALVMAIDVSRSVIVPRWELQKNGYADAFASSWLAAKVRSGSIGAIAATVVQWSSCNQQAQVIRWTTIDSPASALAFSEQIRSMPREFAAGTCPAGGLDFSAKVLLAAPVEARRLIIDISGDGPEGENDRYQPEGSGILSTIQVRDSIISRGITINGLALQVPPEDEFYYNGNGRFVVPFYRDSIVGGRAAFLIVVDNANDQGKFAIAIRQKLEAELSAQLAR